MAVTRHAVALACLLATAQVHAADRHPVRTRSPALVVGGFGVVLFGVAASVGAGLRLEPPCSSVAASIRPVPGGLLTGLTAAW